MQALDNYALFEQYQRERDNWLGSRPKCEYCGEDIQDDYFYVIDGCKVCGECIKDFVEENCKERIC